jgi:UDP:flavonoid glycosyltransferase YjiC (YdhE family)
LPSSPTFHTPEVIGLLEKFQPHVVIFDNAGRTAQLSAAKRTGVRVVYVSARARQRRKAFRWRWMSLIDEHWIAYPEFLAGSLTSLQRLKLHLRGHPTVRYLDVILPDSDPRASASMLDRIGLAAESFALFVPGGGTGHPGVRDEVSVFYAAARDLAARGTPAVLVAPTFDSTAALPSALRTLPRLPLAELAQLMRQARLVVANGGSTLVQAIGCGAACIAVAIAGDQAERIRHCTEAGLALAAPLDANAIVALATQLMGDGRMRSALAKRAADLKLADGLTVALDALDALIRGCNVA